MRKAQASPCMAAPISGGGDGCGQADDDGGSTAGRVLDLHRAVHGLDEAPGDGETETDAGVVGGVAPALEGGEDLLPQRHRDSGAPVDHPQVDLPVEGARLDPDGLARR